ncbi:hypothetical protein WG8_0868 [Paenibacillus sp. Aloe-11]|nr:hypothetical protein WG8_0868 [Paenibacillus sp. Aloe-11]
MHRDGLIAFIPVRLDRDAY